MLSFLRKFQEAKNYPNKVIPYYCANVKICAIFVLAMSCFPVKQMERSGRNALFILPLDRHGPLHAKYRKRSLEKGLE